MIPGAIIKVSYLDTRKHFYTVKIRKVDEVGIWGEWFFSGKANLEIKGGLWPMNEIGAIEVIELPKE